MKRRKGGREAKKSEGGGSLGQRQWWPEATRARQKKETGDERRRARRGPHGVAKGGDRQKAYGSRGRETYERVEGGRDRQRESSLKYWQKREGVDRDRGEGVEEGSPAALEQFKERFITEKASVTGGRLSLPYVDLQVIFRARSGRWRSHPWILESHLSVSSSWQAGMSKRLCFYS